VDVVGGKPLCMHMYKYLFNSCRVPSIPECTTAMADPATNNHILVIRKNKFYSVDVGSGSTRISPAELQAQLERVIAMAGRERAAPIGVLTAEHRDMWSCVSLVPRTCVCMCACLRRACK
jgi:carnitine O-acetyltransferase